MTVLRPRLRRLPGVCAVLLLGSLALLGSLSGCAVSKQSKARTQGRDLAAKSDYAAAGAAFERAAVLATRPAEKSAAYVEAGRAQLSAGEPEKALRLFLEARRAEPRGSVARQMNQGIGEAHFAAGEYYLASRYLEKGMPAAARERERVLALLVVSSRGLDDPARASAYERQLTRPYSPEVKEILAIDPVRLTEIPDIGADETEVDEVPSVSPPRRGNDRGSLVVRPRSEWGARRLDPSRAKVMGLPTRITVHHTADVFLSRSRSDTAAEIRRIQRYHQDKLWADIGYHYVVDRDGAVWQGRDLRYQGAHAGGAANQGNIGIVVLGNYVEQGLTSPQRQQLARLIARLCSRFEIPPQRIYTHGELAHGRTDCPGPMLTRWVAQIRSEIERRLVAYRG